VSVYAADSVLDKAKVAATTAESVYAADSVMDGLNVAEAASVVAMAIVSVTATS
jgi:hypothetical protein